MDNHAKKRIHQPSALKRTFSCPGWGNLCKNIPPKPSNVYAAKGSVAHFVGEQCLTQEVNAEMYLNKNVFYNNGRIGIECSDIAPLEEKGEHFIFTINEEMVEAVQIYVDEIRRKRESVVGGVFKVEEKLDLGWLVPGITGTGDHIIIEPLGCIYVDDYKHGAGVSVEVEDNPSLMTYALMALGEGNPHMVEEVEITIIQPRALHRQGPIRSVRFDAEFLLDWGEKVLKPKVKAAEKLDASLCPGDWCKWCDGQEICPKIREEMFNAVDENPTKDLVPTANAGTFPEPALLDSDKLNRVLEFADVFIDWVKNIKEEAYRRLEKGGEDAPTIVKLVEGKLGNRAYKSDDDSVHNALKTVLSRADIFAPSKVKSPAQMENALKKAGFKPKERKGIINPLLKERTPGKPVMVPVNDSRPALPPAAEIMFGDDDVLNI